MKQMKVVCCALLHFMYFKNDLEGLSVDESRVFPGTCIAVHAI